MAYVHIEEGCIKAKADWPAPGFVETARPVVYGYDGGLYFAGEEPEKPQELIKAEAIASAKVIRAELVEKATVTIDGMVFDADEASQNRLVRGIVASLALGLSPDETTEWTLADNSSAMVTAQQMARALLAAGQYQTSVWRMPYDGGTINE